MPFSGRPALRGRGRCAACAALALAGIAASNASADVAAAPATTIFAQATTTLLSRSIQGQVPNGPSRNAAAPTHLAAIAKSSAAPPVFEAACIAP